MSVTARRKLLDVDEFPQRKQQPPASRSQGHLIRIRSQFCISHAGIVMIAEAVLKLLHHSKGSLNAMTQHGNKQFQNMAQPFSTDAKPMQFRFRTIRIDRLPLLPQPSRCAQDDPLPENRFRGFGNTVYKDLPSTEQLIAAGWGYAAITPNSIQADNGAGLTQGIIGLINKCKPRKPDDWGSLRA